MIKKITRSKFDVLSELRAVNTKLERPEEAGEMPLANPTELIVKRTKLRHELKMFDTVTATGDGAKRIAEHWKRKAEEEQIKIKLQKKKDAELAKKAKSAAKKELKKDDRLRKEIAGDLSIKELEALLAKKKDKK